MDQPSNKFDINQGVLEYLAQFKYRVVVKLGHSHTDEFKEFNVWCEQRLGNKYKDWFLTSKGRGTYTLFCRDSKWASFLALSHVDKLD